MNHQLVDHLSLLVPIFKVKGYPLKKSSYAGINLHGYVCKLNDRFLNKRLYQIADINKTFSSLLYWMY